MPGSSVQTTAPPRPLELLARLLAAAALVLWLSHSFQRAFVKPLIPAFSTALRILNIDFTILGIDVSEDGPNETLRFRANLAHPIEIAGRRLSPFGWGSIPEGGYQVNLTLGGILQYCALTLILVLAWPARHAREFAVRLLSVLPLMGILLLIDVPFTVLAELWNAIHAGVDPHGFQPLMIWSRFLMGGGGLMLALLAAALAIALARRWGAGKSGLT
jgi:hypothetical protein